MGKKLLITLFKYGLGPAVLIFVVWKNWRQPGGLGIAAFLEEPIQQGAFLTAFLLYFVGVLLTFVRWYLLVRAQDLPFTLWNALRLGMVGYFYSTFFPGSIGGDAVKAFLLAKDQNRRTVAVATVLLDRIVGLWGLFWLVSLVGSGFWLAGDASLHESRGLQTVLVGSIAVVVVSVITWVLLGLLPDARATRFAERLAHIPKVGHSAAEFWRAIWMYRRKSLSIAAALGLSLVAQVNMVIAFFYAAQVFLQSDSGEAIPTLAQHFVIVPVGLVVEALFPSPGGVGGGEYGFGALYQLVMDTPGAQARGVLASLTKRSIALGIGAIGYVFYLVMKPSLPTSTEQPGEADAASPAETPVESVLSRSQGTAPDAAAD